MSKWVRNPEQAIEALQEQFDILKEQANAVVAKPKELLKYTDYSKENYKWSQYNQRGGSFTLRTEYYFKNTGGYGYSSDVAITDEKLKSVLSYFDSTTDQWKKDNEETRKANQEIIKFNIEQKDKVKLIMKTIGVQDTYSTYSYKTSRSRNKTETKHQAGYIGDLTRTIKTSDNYQVILRNIQEKRDQIEKYGLSKIKECAQKKLEADKVAKENTKLAELALLRAKYTPTDAESGVDELLDLILDKNKYLHLAHYLLQNRNDWNDGYGYAEYGLEGFEPESKLDWKIEKELHNIVYENDGDIDGRVFRDCTYNYNALFLMVEDESLMNDYNLVIKYLD